MSKTPTARVAVRVWALQNNTTQGDIAIKLGVDEGFFSKVLSGRRPVSDELASELRKLTGIDLRALKRVA